MLFTGDPLQISRHMQNESEGMENVFHANENQLKPGRAILISDNIDFIIIFDSFLHCNCLSLKSSFNIY